MEQVSHDPLTDSFADVLAEPRVREFADVWTGLVTDVFAELACWPPPLSTRSSRPGVVFWGLPAAGVYGSRGWP